MNIIFYKLGFAMLDKLRVGNYTPFKSSVATKDMLNIYVYLVGNKYLLPIEQQDEEVKDELKQWAKNIGYGNNTILGVNICKCLLLLSFDFEPILKK